MAKKIPERNELAESDKWALEDLYPTNEAWQRDLETFKTLSDEMAGYAGQLSRADKLLEYLRLTEKTGVYLEKIVNYAQRRSDEDTRDSYYQGLVGQMTKAWVGLGEKTSFEVPELIEISDERMESLYREQPALELYRRHLDDIRRRRAHILSKSEEKLLAAAGEMAQSPEQIYSMNPKGAVVTENTNGIVTVNGHSYEDPAKQTRNTNFALLVSKHFTEPFKDSNGYGESIARLSNMEAVAGVAIPL